MKTEISIYVVKCMSCSKVKSIQCKASQSLGFIPTTRNTIVEMETNLNGLYHKTTQDV